MSLRINHNNNSIASGNGVLHLNENSGAIILPQGNATSRPVDTETGMLRYNTDDKNIEVFQGTAWDSIGGGVVGTSVGFVSSTGTALNSRTIVGSNYITVSNPSGIGTANTSLAFSAPFSAFNDVQFAAPVNLETLVHNGSSWINTRSYGIKNYAPAGDFALNPWSRQTSFTGLTTNNQFYNTADRFQYYKNGTMVCTVDRHASYAPMTNLDKIFSPASLRINVTTPQASISSTNIVSLTTKIEGCDAINLYKRPASIGFDFYAPVAGTYHVCLRNADSYAGVLATSVCIVLPFVVTAPNTWQFINIDVPTIPYPNSAMGTPVGWNVTNGIGLGIEIILAAGLAYQTASTGTWQTGADNRAGTGQVKGVAGVGEFRVGKFCINPGRGLYQIANCERTPLVYHCKRYFEKSYLPDVFSGTPSIPGSIHVVAISGSVFYSLGYTAFQEIKRDIPQVTVWNSTSGAINNIGGGAATILDVCESSFRVSGSGRVPNDAYSFHYYAEAEL